MSELKNAPPHNIEAEQACLGACLVDPDAATVIGDILAGPNDFYRENHQVIYKAIRRLADRGKTIDLVTVCDLMRSVKTKNGQSYLDAAGGPGYIDSLVSIVQSSAHAAAYAQIVADRAVERRLQTAGRQIERIAMSGDATPATKLERASEVLAEAGSGAVRFKPVPARECLETYADWLGERELSADERAEGKSPPAALGISTGFPKVDKLIGGMVPGEVIVIAGRPGMGKTALGQCFTEALAMEGPCLFWSGEMTRMKIARRYAARQLGIKVKDVRAVHAYHAADNAPAVWIDDERGISAQRLATKLATFHLQHPNMSGLVVDYLSLLAEGNDYKEVSKASRKLLEIAGRHNIPVIALQQLSRDVERRDSKIPQLGDLRESGQIEQDAAVVLMPYRPHYYKDDADPARAEIWVRKNRDGPANRYCVLMWDAESATFRNPPPKTENKQGTLDDDAPGKPLDGVEAGDVPG